MADSSALTGLLDRAGKVFELARSLSWDLQQDSRSQGPVFMACGESPRLRHLESINKFIAAVLDLQDAIKNPPAGFEAVAEQLREAAKLARSFPRLDDWAILDQWPYLKQVACHGLQAIKDVIKARRLDDPWAFIDEPAAPPGLSLLDRFPATPTGHIGFLECVRDEVRYAAEATRQQLARGYSNDTLAAMVRGIRWVEAGQRVLMLSDLAADTVDEVARVLRRELTIGTVEQIDELLYPAMRLLRDAWENRDVSASANVGGQDFIDRLLAGPDDAELTPRELAFLEAYVKNDRLIPSLIQREKRASPTGESETLRRRYKLARIRDYNRNLRASPGFEVDSHLGAASRLSDKQTTADSGHRKDEASKSGVTRKRPGRRKADYATVQGEAQLVADWNQARESGTCKLDFAKQNNMTLKDLDALLDRVAKRKARSDK